MEKHGIASLWLGTVDTKSNLDNLLRVSYTKEGQFIPSKFAQAFGIDRYEDETREADIIDKPQTSIRNLLEGFSYDDIMIPRFSFFKTNKPLTSYNAIVLFYNFEYVGSKKKLRKFKTVTLNSLDR